MPASLDKESDSKRQLLALLIDAARAAEIFQHFPIWFKSKLLLWSQNEGPRMRTFIEPAERNVAGCACAMARRFLDVHKIFDQGARFPFRNNLIVVGWVGVRIKINMIKNCHVQLCVYLAAFELIASPTPPRGRSSVV